MKRILLIFAAVILTFLSACANQSNDFSIEMLPDSIEQVTVSHYLSGEETEWALEADGLEKWKSWLEGLSARQKIFEEGNTPGDSDGGEVYSFTINNGEASISYVINGSDECYVLCESEWHAVSNPTNPF
ncbi:hypothetical protein SAMN04488542_11054 [Fontibacillus panacisegetis]|uniref:Uncharacterized protein n=1 Tax=Fontibacillus panacisegetis TaxID=670482 RepID=A0A1G7KSL7_9BACL|nr:hypothetical protein [Fontibacillus panacisegetis]SDF40064.1 hypothetical protein SAMN04488542_11054 [Fontibacillus panacisegetis]